MSEPGRKPRSPILRSMGKEATHDTGAVAEESGKRQGKEKKKQINGLREATISHIPAGGAAIYTTVAGGNPTWGNTMGACKL